MSLICAWCSRWIRKETPVGMISHGICKRCSDELGKQLAAEEEAEKTCQKH